jgi:hypothetical protein
MLRGVPRDGSGEVRIREGGWSQNAISSSRQGSERWGWGETIKERVLEMTTLTVPSTNMKPFPPLRSLLNARTDHKPSRLNSREEGGRREEEYLPSAENDARQKEVERMAPWKVWTALW